MRDDTSCMSLVIVEHARRDDQRAPKLWINRSAVHRLQPRESAVDDQPTRLYQHHSAAAHAPVRVAHGAPDELDVGLIRVDHSASTLDDWRHRGVGAACERQRARVVDQVERLNPQQRAARDLEEPRERRAGTRRRPCRGAARGRARRRGARRGSPTSSRSGCAAT